MKKQVVSFLALFGLVLVLSVYYVLLPNNLFVKPVSPNTGNELNVGVTIDEASNLFFSELNTKLDDKHNNIIYSFEEIVASDSRSNEDKETALNMLNHQQKIMENEDFIVSLIKELGYYNAFVEYQEDMIKVVVQANSLTNQQAAELITLVIENSVSSLLPEIEYVE